MIRQKRVRMYRIADSAMLMLAITTAVLASPGQTTTSDFLWGAGYALLTLLILEARGFYGLRLHQSPVDMIARVFAATSIAAMVLTFSHAIIDNEPQIAQQTLRLWVFALVFLGAGRLGITFDRARALRRGETGLNTLIVGSGSVGHLIAQRLVARPELGLRPIGFLDKEPLIDNTEERDGLPVLGASWDLQEVVQRYNVEQVIVTFSTAPHAVMLNLIRRCRELGVEVVVVPRLFEEVNNRVEVEHLGGVPLLRAATVDPKGWQFAFKYALDRIIAGLGLIAISPLLGMLALAVRLSSPGPIFYRQRRVGLDGREFDMLKFRSMRVAESSDDFVPQGGMAPGGVEGVDRRTRVGEFLRRTSLDELPQLVNVLRGEMSLVGPRPERTRFARSFEQHVYRYGDRHRVKSGLTGWAQVQGLRGQTSLADRVEWDNYYIENWSLWLDLKIALMTVPALLGRQSVE
ncbi:sugar transferase [Conexibacter stalactiti]|uniref:Sugar transferase n=1 Tax=Conexibacter stalactiti TaxID=1940611 RepID=A0ABU4I010_9ACTN|nr:sugar transferase [Conexibacter stalactiti]MDW5598800.1 sugar transferase [Conexibacter stalactiti]MEC5039442.1 sugar transferase [Conexibacter stalactiti]